ncbi:MAG: acyl-ACP--UDP-N-acetylglucosamine O-acyltransferase [Proteobacteria bacterium]|nr:acyl-ACP--UDP-N-acetylglucosamine O-acyltransferase [Pseudomonadota bacterium]MBU1688870.1 acyl-ACP--UDP-N-acetylglucosamine O-acyltransferase [Pseudomonadota bacterium]
MTIHPTAIIDRGAELDSTVSVGPYAVIECGVKIGPDTEIGPHTVIGGPTEIGTGNRIGPFANIGAPPQDLRYNNEPTLLQIGDHNLIREYVTIHRGTPDGRGSTVLGSNNMLMANAHVAHDCTIGNHVIMANAASLAGHVLVEDRANLGGFVAVHQFNRIGCYAYIGGMSGLTKDVPPYTIVAGTRNQMRIAGINRIGLKRNGFTPEQIRDIYGAYKIIFLDHDLLLQDALVKAETAFPHCDLVRHLVEFFRTSERGVVRMVGEDE